MFLWSLHLWHKKSWYLCDILKPSWKLCVIIKIIVLLCRRTVVTLEKNLLNCIKIEKKIKISKLMYEKIFIIWKFKNSVKTSDMSTRIFYNIKTTERLIFCATTYSINLFKIVKMDYLATKLERRIKTS